MLKDIVSGTAGLIGVSLISIGSYMIFPAAGFIAPGSFLVLFSYLLSRSTGGK